MASVESDTCGGAYRDAGEPRNYKGGEHVVGGDSFVVDRAGDGDEPFDDH